MRQEKPVRPAWGIFGIWLAAASIMSVWAATTPQAAPASVPVVSGDVNVYVNLSKKLVPSVVNISTISTVKSPIFQGGNEDLFRKFFGDMFRQYHGRGGGGDEEEPFSQPQLQPRMPKAVALGTGFIIDSSGLILTNNHVVADADEIKISFTEARDEKPSDAEVVGRDPELDVALVKVKTKREMVPVTLGDSDQLEVGEYVMAVGNPFGQGHSVTHGIISAKGRIAPDFPLAGYLQTDAPINPGNSGGPLTNLKGEVIGINNAIDQRAQGIGFAIPINVVKKVLPQLRSKGTVARGYIGVLVDPLTPEVAKKMGIKGDIKGTLVSHVYPGEPADKAGLKPYDVIVEFAGKATPSGDDLVAAVTSVNVGDSTTVKVWRGKEMKTFHLKVSQRPGSKQAVLKEDREKKKSTKPAHVETGMVIEDITSEMARELGLETSAKGVVVTQIAFGGPADRAGLLRGDVILEVDQKSIDGVDGFYSIVKSKKSYLLRVRRPGGMDGKEVFSVVVLDIN